MPFFTLIIFIAYTENSLKRNADKGKFFFSLINTLSTGFLIFAAKRENRSIKS